MRYVNIKGTDLTVSALALGTATLGSAVNDDDSYDILDTFLDSGGTFFDTANAYGRRGNPEQLPMSEILLGKWLVQRKSRGEIILATKGAARDMDFNPRLSPNVIKSDLEDSLKNLHTDYIDMYYLHQDDERQPIESIITTLNDLKKEGKIRYFGCSNWSARRMLEANAFAKKNNLESFAVDQMMLNLAHVNPERVIKDTQRPTDVEMIDYHVKTQMPVAAYSAQARGIFVLSQRDDFDTNPNYSNAKEFFLNETTLKRIKHARELAIQKGISIMDVALGYLYAQPFQVVPIIGPWKVSELKESLTSVDCILSQDEINFLLS